MSLDYNTGGISSTWNGGVCSTCGARYLGGHRCSREDIARRIAELTALMDRPETTTLDVAGMSRAERHQALDALHDDAPAPVFVWVED